MNVSHIRNVRHAGAQGGFTLIELIVVIVILVVVFVFGDALEAIFQETCDSVTQSSTAATC